MCKFECVWIAVRTKRKRKKKKGGNPSSRSEDYSQTESKPPRQLGKTRIKTQGGKITSLVGQIDVTSAVKTAAVHEADRGKGVKANCQIKLYL